MRHGCERHAVISVGGVGLLDGEMETHTDRMAFEGRHAQGYFVPAGRKSLEMSRQACNKANEEIYPSPLLVNIKLIQPS